MSESTRAWIYRAVLAIVAVAGVFGYLTDEQGATIVALVGGLLGAGLATANTSTKKAEPEG